MTMTHFLRQRFIAFTVAALALTLLGFHAFCSAADAWPPSQTPAEIAATENGKVKLLRLLKRRDSLLDKRTLEIEKRWIEKIVPRSEVLQRQRANLAAGTGKNDLDKAPAPYDQPHRLLHKVTFDGSVHAMEIVDELETPINTDYSRPSNAGSIWSNANNELADYSQQTGIAHRQTIYTGNLLGQYVRSFKWTCGFGYAKYIQQIRKTDVLDGRIVLFGAMQLLDIHETGFTLHLDDDWIVRKAVISVPARDGGNNEYLIVTEDVSRFGDAPAVAKTGRYRRIVRPPNRRFRILDDYEIATVSLTGKLTQQQFSDATTVKIPDSATVVDTRNLIGP